MPSIRLQKVLSAAGVASRRAAEGLITEGRVSVNGTTITSLGTRADPEADDIRVDGRRLRAPAARRYILINKPAGVMSTRDDPRGRPTVLNLLGRIGEYLYPVGRLDYDSEGLLLVTNDGELTAALTHPRHGVVKVYEAVVQGVPDASAVERLRRGVVIDNRKTAPAEVRIKKRFAAGRGREGAVLEIGLREGRNRQIRRMCDAVGHRVERLTRVRIGPLADPRLRVGTWRDLSEAEVRALKALGRAD